MKLNDIVKNIKGIRVSTDTKIILAGLLLVIGVDRCAFSHEDVDTTAVDNKIKAAKTSLDSVTVLRNSAVAMRDMYQRKCDSLCPRVGVPEAPSDRARKNREWIQYRDSLSKYRDQATVQEIARGWAQLRVDTLVSKRDIMKMR